MLFRSMKIKQAWQRVPMLPVGWGEVFDKLTILQIKTEKLTDITKLENVKLEREQIETVIGDIIQFPGQLVGLMIELKSINERIWDIENAKRDCELRQCFDESFITLAREVYFYNDQRALIKRKINLLLDSIYVEEKSYKAY